MLESVEIRNFQRHRRLRIEFDPAVTCITGVSDQGKSSILRALRWLAFNRPAGDGIVRRVRGVAAGTVAVVATVDGHCVRHARRADGSKWYELDGRRFHAVGQDVPDEIAALLNVGPVCFSGQHDLSFWFADTSGQVAKSLNQIVNLDLIDRTLANLAAEGRRAKAAVEVGKQRLADAQGRAAALPWVEAANGRLSRIEELQALASEVRQKSSRIADLLRRASEAREAGEVAQRACLHGQKAVSLGERALRLRERASRIRGFLDGIAAKREERDAAAREAARLAGELRERLQGRCPFCGGEWEG